MEARNTAPFDFDPAAIDALVVSHAHIDHIGRVPLLIVPPPINRFYVVDLSPGRSFVEWAVARGHTVFAISYVNPGSEHRDSGLDDYLSDGLLSALDVVGAITGSEHINVAGLCVGP